MPVLSFLHAGCPSCRPTNSVKALKASIQNNNVREKIHKEKEKSLKMAQIASCLILTGNTTYAESPNQNMTASIYLKTNNEGLHSK